MLNKGDEVVIRRIILVLLDSVGIGALPDAEDYGDTGSNTLGNLADAVGGLRLPNLQKMGLGNLTRIKGVDKEKAATAAYGRLTERSCGKDTITGHWELAGILLSKPFPVFPDGFPQELIKSFEERIGRRTLGNVVASGTEIIQKLGPEHEKTGYPIVYTSADSVFQVAAHEEVIPVKELYEICEIARELLVGPYGVGRVIARPFIGKPGAYQRTSRRHDYSIKPVAPTMLDQIKAAELEVIGVGKIYDIFAGQGITQTYSTRDNSEGIEKILSLMQKTDWEGLLWANLVDFDMLWGHRNDPVGYARGMEEFDKSLPCLLQALSEDDVLMITADHGCDPTTISTDHSREYVPWLIYGEQIKAGLDLQTRPTFADLGATVCGLLGVEPLPTGTNLAEALITATESYMMR